MRFLTLALAGVACLSFVSLTAEPAQAVGLCADESGHNGNADLYNNMGGPASDCGGIFCMGYSNQHWQTCVPPTIYCTTSALPCGPGVEIAVASAAATFCVYGDLYNNAQGPSSGCDGAVCTGYANGDWDRCVLDCTVDGCPRFDGLLEDPCRRLMCQPPFDP